MAQVTANLARLHQSKLPVVQFSRRRAANCIRDARQIAKAVKSGEELDKKTLEGVQASQNGATNCEPNNVYPKYERTASVLEEGLFPVREPGDFPDVTVAAPNTFLSSLAVDFSENASLDEDAFDPLRDGPLRYLGYSNEIGEAFAAWLPPGGVPFSYAMAISYVLVDTYDKWLKASRRAKIQLDEVKDLDPSINKEKLVQLLSAERALDTVIWQLIASVAAPGYTIHTIVALTLAGLVAAEGVDSVQSLLLGAAATASLPYETLVEVINKTLPTGVGLAVIPFIVHPIDNGVHWVMNKTLRPAMRQYVCNNGGGAVAGMKLCSDECSVEEGSKQ